MKRLLQIGCCVLLLSAVCVAEDAKTAVVVGEPAPDMTLTGIDGKPFKLSSITASGKNVALMFSRAHW
jgi:hypothetical protein